MNYNFFYFLIVYLVILKGCEGSTGSEVGGRNENLTEQQNPYLVCIFIMLNNENFFKFAIKNIYASKQQI